MSDFSCSVNFVSCLLLCHMAQKFVSCRDVFTFIIYDSRRHSFSYVLSFIMSWKLKSFPSHTAPYGSTDLCFHSPQPDTSRSCKSMDTGLVCHVECLFSSQLMPVPIYTAWWTEAHVCEQLAQSCYVKQSGRDSNLQPIGCKSDAVTTTPPRHIRRDNYVYHITQANQSHSESFTWSSSSHQPSTRELAVPKRSFWMELQPHNIGLNSAWQWVQNHSRWYRVMVMAMLYEQCSTWWWWRWWWWWFAKCQLSIVVLVWTECSSVLTSLHHSYFICLWLYNCMFMGQYVTLLMFVGPNRHQQQTEDATLPAELPYRPLLLYHPKVLFCFISQVL